MNASNTQLTTIQRTLVVLITVLVYHGLNAPMLFAQTAAFKVDDASNTNLMNVNTDAGMVIKGALSTGSIPATGAGVRMMWYPKRAAFRVGYVGANQWDDAYIGTSSVAMGYNSVASDNYSIAIGYTAIANAFGSTAIGYSTASNAYYSTAMGFSTTASGTSSTALGYSTVASGHYSTTMGYYTIASGNYSTTMGYYTTASGLASTAKGSHTTANGNYSTAMGCYASTNGYAGSCIIGDNSTATTTNSSAADQMTMRFNGGYRIYSNSGLSTGVYMNGGVSGWTSYCDRNKKENFRPVDGEMLLSKIKSLPITEWNYKNTDAAIRYIGPMAQDFWQAFHLGGTDSLGINSISIDGVNMAAIQALEKRTSELKEALGEIEQLKTVVKNLVQANQEMARVQEEIRDTNANLQQANREMNQRLVKLESRQPGQATNDLHSEILTQFQEK